jgi:hypothetical protein
MNLPPDRMVAMVGLATGERFDDRAGKARRPQTDARRAAG